MFWNGEILRSPLGFDTETELIKSPLEIPRLSLMIVCDGSKSLIVHPEDVTHFLNLHRRHRFYGYNLRFDFWVLERYSRVLFDAANANQVYCLRLLRRLVKLALSGVPERQGTLADACKEYGIESPDKNDPYRLRYGELIGLSKEEMQAHPEWQGFASYALTDAIVTHALIEPMERHAREIMKKHAKAIHPDAVKRWGLLSVGLQTRADIVLDYLSRQALRIDTESLQAIEDDARSVLSALSDELEESCPGLWKTYKKTGLRMVSKTSHLPKRDEKALISRLTAIAKEKDRPVLKTVKGEVSTSAKDWHRWCPHPWTEKWLEYELLKKRLSTMLVPMKAGTIYADYETLIRTGRTSASKHKKLASLPIQQVPRDNAFRKLFLADPDCLRLTIDYSYLELRTLAACCQVRYGFSKLADAIREHTRAVKQGRKGVPDPHEYMACQILRLSPEQFFALPEDERKKARQSAKAANFGFPGGLGYARFQEYARNPPYNLKYSKDEAKALKEQWLETFPEMRLWLADQTLENLAENLGTTEKAIRSQFGEHLWYVRQVIEGYHDDEAKTRSVITKLRTICRNKDVRSMLDEFDGSTLHHEQLANRILTGYSSTPTGRVRGKVGYSDGANSPFQGLASDGGKEALWRLVYSGYNVKAFIHDEILIDAPEETLERVRFRIHQILDSAMESVMLGDIPCMSESHVGKTWVKG